MNDSSKDSSTSAPSLNVSGANDRIAVAVVGLGIAIGQNHFFGLRENAEENNIVVAAACDVYEQRRLEAIKRTKLGNSDVYLDYRRILDRKDVDAIVIATHDPLHAQISLDALDAGKHVYCERPLTRHLGEAFSVYDKVKGSKKIFQLGVQGCSSGAWRKCAELLQSGKVGKLVWSQGFYSRNGGPMCDGYLAVDDASSESTVDWNAWLGPLKKRPFNATHFHQWRVYSDYSAGLLGSHAPQPLHVIMLASGQPEFPSRVNCVASHHLPKDDPYRSPPDPGQLPAHTQLQAEFPNGSTIALTCSWLNATTPGVRLYCHKATLAVNNSEDRVDVIPEREFRSELSSETFEKLGAIDIRRHEKNWFDCIRSGKTSNADIELAIRAQTVLSLAEISNLRKTTCLFDAATRKITDGAGNEISPPSYES
jgi:predicted dehydrogenase